MADDNITVKLDLKGARQFARDAARSAAGIDAIAAAAKRANRIVRELGVGLNRLAANTRAYDRAMRDAERSANRLQRQTERLRRELDRAGNSQRRLGNQTRTSASHFSGLSKSVGIARTALGGIAQVGATAALALGGAGVAAVGFGLKTYSANEQASVAFTTMLHSAEKAQAFIKDMKEFAFNTPFSVQDVQDASRQLLAFGFKANEVLPILQKVGDASSALGLGAEGVKRYTYALGQLKATPYVQGDEIRQLQELGIPAYQILSKATGKSLNPGNLAEAKVSSQGAIQALLKYSEANYGGLMDAQSKTLGGLWNNFKERISQASAEGVRPLAEALKRILPGAAKAAESAVNGLGKGLGWVVNRASRLAPLFKELRTAFKYGGVDEVVNQLDQKLGLKGTLNEFWDTLKKLGVQVYDFIFKTVFPILKMLLPTGLKILSVFGTAITAVLTTVNTLAPIIKVALWPVQKFVDVTLDSVRSLFDFLQKIGTWLGGSSKNAYVNPIKTPAQVGPAPTAPFGPKASTAFPSKVPGAATGGTVYRAGTVRVGEGGPEWLNLPKGANIQPNSNVMKPQAAASPAVVIQPGGIQINGVTNAEGKRLAKIVVDQIKTEIARK